MARTEYRDSEAEKAYQDVSDNSSKPSAPDFNDTFDQANRANDENYTSKRMNGLIDTGIWKRHEGSFPPSKDRK